MRQAGCPEPHTAGAPSRKKAKTRAVIQRRALRLFHDQGYKATTVEQIAEAAEVSPSTFFRYFRTKEDVFLYDPFDPVLIEAVQLSRPTCPPSRPSAPRSKPYSTPCP